MASSIELAVLCSAATFRNDLLSILDAGITSLKVEGLPVVAEVTLAAQFAFTEPDIGDARRIIVEAHSEAGGRLALLTFVATPQRPPNADLAFPFLFTIIQRLALPLSDEGLYAITVQLEGSQNKRLPLRVSA